MSSLAAAHRTAQPLSGPLSPLQQSLPQLPRGPGPCLCPCGPCSPWTQSTRSEQVCCVLPSCPRLLPPRGRCPSAERSAGPRDWSCVLPAAPLTPSSQPPTGQRPGLLAVPGHPRHCLHEGVRQPVALSGTFCPVRGTCLPSEPWRVCRLLCGSPCPPYLTLNRCPRPALTSAPPHHHMALFFPLALVTPPHTHKECDCGPVGYRPPCPLERKPCEGGAVWPACPASVTAALRARARHQEGAPTTSVEQRNPVTSLGQSTAPGTSLTREEVTLWPLRPRETQALAGNSWIEA